jgi:chromosome segregation ATPase
MPIPLLVAGIAVLVSGLGSAGGVAVYKNNKYNKAQKEWQEQRLLLQTQIKEYQNQLRLKEVRIIELQNKLAERTKQLEIVTQKLFETDNMIELLEKRHTELESLLHLFIALITFSYKKHKSELNNILGQISANEIEKNSILALISKTKDATASIESEIQTISNEQKYYEEEIAQTTIQLERMEA